MATQNMKEKKLTNFGQIFTELRYREVFSIKGNEEPNTEISAGEHNIVELIKY